MEDLRNRLLMEECLLNEIARINNITWDGDKMQFQSENDGALNWDDSVSIAIDIDSINQINFWGDGTIEFQLKEDDESLNWFDFDDNTIMKVITALSNVK